MYLPGEVGVILLCRLEHDLDAPQAAVSQDAIHVCRVYIYIDRPGDARQACSVFPSHAFDPFVSLCEAR